MTITVILRDHNNADEEAKHYSIIFSDKPSPYGLFNARMFDETNQEVISITKSTYEEVSQELIVTLKRLGKIIDFKEIVADEATKKIIKILKDGQ